MDPDLIFVNGLIEEQASAKRTYMVLSILLFLLALITFCFALRSHDNKTFPTLASVVIAAIGAIPTKLVFAVRAYKLYCEFLRNAWQQAHAVIDQDAIAALHTEIVGIRQSGLTKGWW